MYTYIYVFRIALRGQMRITRAVASGALPRQQKRRLAIGGWWRRSRRDARG